MSSAEIISADGIVAGYGSVRALWGASAKVFDGETVVLLGANGAGKTTFLRTLMGLIPALGGKISFMGKDIEALRTDRRVRAGLCYMSEMGCFPGLTVDENIRIGGQFLPASALRARIAEMYATFPALASRRNALASTLSGGQRKMLGIAKALAGNPRLILMDEPSSGLSPLLVKEVIAVLARFAGQGVSLLIAEQNVNFLKLADRVYIMNGGRIGFEGTAAELERNGALHREFFGLG